MSNVNLDEVKFMVFSFCSLNINVEHLVTISSIDGLRVHSTDYCKTEQSECCTVNHILPSAIFSGIDFGRDGLEFKMAFCSSSALPFMESQSDFFT